MSRYWGHETVTNDLENMFWSLFSANIFYAICSIVKCPIDPWLHDDVIKWKLFPRHWPFVWGIHRSPGNSPKKRPVTRSFDVLFDLWSWVWNHNPWLIHIFSEEIKCPKNCQKCDDDGKCTRCKAGFRLRPKTKNCESKGSSWNTVRHCVYRKICFWQMTLTRMREQWRHIYVLDSKCWPQTLSVRWNQISL